MRSVFVFIAMAILSCTTAQQQMSATQKAAVAAEIKLMLANYVADIKKDGLLAEFRYLDTTDDFYWVPPAYTTYISFDSVSRILKANAGMFRTIDNQWQTLKIDPLTPTLASYTGKLQSLTKDNSGKASNMTLIETGLVIKRSDGWKLLSGQTAIIDP